MTSRAVSRPSVQMGMRTSGGRGILDLLKWSIYENQEKGSFQSVSEKLATKKSILFIFAKNKTKLENKEI